MRFALHRLMVVEVPLHHEFPVPINVHVARRMVTDPCDQDVPAAPVFAKL